MADLLPPALLEFFNLESMKGYSDESLLDVASNDLAPKLTIWTNGNQKLLGLVRDEGKSPSDILESALQKLEKQDLRGQFMVLFKARELFINKEDSSSSFGSLKESISSDYHGANGKEFFARRVKVTPSIALKFVSKFHMHQQ